MSEHIKKFALQHLNNYHYVVVNGTSGTDHMYPDRLDMRSFSPIYNMFAGDELTKLINNTDKLHEKAKIGQKETDIGTLADPLLNFFRADFFNKLALAALKQDEENPHRIHKQDFFDAIRELNIEHKDAIYTYFSNLRIVMEIMFGENWEKENKEVISIFNIYTNYWNEKQNFLEMQKKRL
jgi:hypothetical protein